MSKDIALGKVLPGALEALDAPARTITRRQAAKLVRGCCGPRVQVARGRWVYESGTTA